MNHVPRPPCQVPCRQDQTFHLPFLNRMQLKDLMIGQEAWGKANLRPPVLRGKITSTIKSPSKELERVQKHVVQRTPSLVLHGKKNIHS